MSEVSLDDIVSLAKRRGFIYQGSDIYGGLAGTWDYGPLGTTLKRNIQNLWWQMFVEQRDDMYGLDAAIMMNQKVWRASGHVDTFTDPLVECSNCHSRMRADHIIDEAIKKNQASPSAVATEENTPKNIEANLGILKPKCPVCGKENTLGTPRMFNMMFKTHIGPIADQFEVTNAPEWKWKPGESRIFNDNDISWTGTNTVYLRPETAQGIFANFKNIIDTYSPDLPFGIAQIGKAFRNEISPRDFIFRAREFEQMEIEYFVEESKWKEEFGKWIEDVYNFLSNVGISKTDIHELEVPAADRAHYSKRTIDFEFDYAFGKSELLGLAYRGSFDLDSHQKASGKTMEYRPKDGSKPFVPHVIEPSFGVDRLILAILSVAYSEDEQNGEKRIFLKLPPNIAPTKIAVSPLLKNKKELAGKAHDVYNALKKDFSGVVWDDNGNIGKRYRRQDEIGTPYCVTIDFDTLDDDTVTVRDRDTTKQERVKIDELSAKLKLS